MLKKFIKEVDTKSKSGAIKRQIISHSLKNGNFTIPDLAKILDISVPTITKYITELCDCNYMSDYGKLETSGGRHPSIYGVNADFCYFVGVDIRKFSLSVMIMNFAGEIKESQTYEDFILTNTVDGLENLISRIQNTILASGIEEDLIMSANVTLPGRINSERGYSYTMYNFEDRPLAEIFTERLGFHTTIENDTRAMTYGEYITTYNEKPRNLILVNLSWGLGVGLVLGGKIFTGKSGFAGEFGHYSVFDNEIMCHCGKKGCLETEVSGSAMHRELIKAIKGGASSVLSAQVLSNKEVSLHDIIRALEKEDPLCIDLIEAIAQKLGRNLANLINLLNPEQIVIGGTLSAAGDYLLQPTKTAIRKFSLNLVSKDSNITLSKLEPRSGVLGSVWIARMRMFDEQ